MNLSFSQIKSWISKQLRSNQLPSNLEAQIWIESYSFQISTLPFELNQNDLHRPPITWGTELYELIILFPFFVSWITCQLSSWTDFRKNKQTQQSSFWTFRKLLLIILIIIYLPAFHGHCLEIALWFEREGEAMTAYITFSAINYSSELYSLGLKRYNGKMFSVQKKKRFLDSWTLEQLSVRLLRHHLFVIAPFIYKVFHNVSNWPWLVLKVKYHYT